MCEEEKKAQYIARLWSFNIIKELNKKKTEEIIFRAAQRTESYKFKSFYVLLLWNDAEAKKAYYDGLLQLTLDIVENCSEDHIRSIDQSRLDHLHVMWRSDWMSLFNDM